MMNSLGIFPKINSNTCLKLQVCDSILLNTSYPGKDTAMLFIENGINGFYEVSKKKRH